MLAGVTETAAVIATCYRVISYVIPQRWALFFDLKQVAIGRISRTNRFFVPTPSIGEFVNLYPINLLGSASGLHEHQPIFPTPLQK
jgi:hypothetical protein